MKTLPLQHYNNAIAAMDKVNINHYFAKSVLVHNTDGLVYVDNIPNPQCFYIISNYVMSLIYGNHLSKTASDFIVTHMQKNTLNRRGAEWLQVFPLHWNEIIKQKLANKLILIEHKEQLAFSENIRNYVIEHTRVNFEFNESHYNTLIKNNLKEELATLSSSQFVELEGEVTPKHFWKNKSLFNDKGKGFCILKNNEVASAAFSACVDDNIIEIGIETAKNIAIKATLSRYVLN